MKLTYVFSLLLITMLLTACGPSAEEKRQVEMEQQRIEQEVSERLAKEKRIELLRLLALFWVKQEIWMPQFVWRK